MTATVVAFFGQWMLFSLLAIMVPMYVLVLVVIVIYRKVTYINSPFFKLAFAFGKR